MRRLITGLALTGALVIASVAPTFAAQPVKTTIWLDGVKVRTIVPPAAMSQPGVDNFYRVPDVGGVAAVGPGDKGYHGGKWKVYDVIFTDGWLNLTSEEAILEAKKYGRVTLTRVAADDFKCPIRGK